MNDTMKKLLLCFTAGVLISGLTVYQYMKPVTGKAATADLEFTVPYQIHDVISENYIFRFIDRSSDSEITEGTRMVTVPEEPQIMTAEQFAQVAEGNMDACDEKGRLTLNNISVKYYRTYEQMNHFTAFIRDDDTGRTWHFEFFNLQAAEVIQIIYSVRPVTH